MYNDDMMTFDDVKQRYILTNECALANNVDLGKELNSTGVPSRSNLPAQILDRISRTVYNFIYSHGDRYGKEKELAENDYYRPFIKDAMIEQLLYFMVNGDLSVVARVDAQTGREFSRAAKLDAAYAPEMQNILAQSGILYCGFTPR
ncbi:MAG: hypothetical protein IJX39_08745 [Clostridia bacterium]|nr:hypothetical protein [Clostridia bacterium]